MRLETEIPEGAEILTKGVSLYHDPKKLPRARLNRGDWYIKVGKPTKMDTCVGPLDFQPIKCRLGPNKYFVISSTLG